MAIALVAGGWAVLRVTWHQLTKDPTGVVRRIRAAGFLFEGGVSVPVVATIMAGGSLVAAVVLVFLWNWRSTIIAAIAIPTSIIATFGLIWYQGFTLNSMTLLALTLAVGIVIDDAIVVLENIFRFVEEKKMEPFEAARAATASARSGSTRRAASWRSTPRPR